MAIVRKDDWVAFQDQNGKIVIGRALYFGKYTFYPYKDHVVTDIGSVALDDVLEARSSKRVRQAQS